MDVCTLYFSRAVEPFEAHLQTILAQSRWRNAQLGITGILLYVRGNIIQVLEGEQQTLQTLYQRIEVDPRHHHVEHILTRPIAQRLFAGWSMSYETISHYELEEIRAVCSLETSELTPVDEPLVLRVIRTFYESNRHSTTQNLDSQL